MKYKIIKKSQAGKSSTPNKPGPNKPGNDGSVVTPPPKKKSYKPYSRKDSDQAYDRTEEGKQRNIKYRSSEKEAISRKNRNARSVAKREVTRAQVKLDVLNAKLEDAKNINPTALSKIKKAEAKLGEAKILFEAKQRKYEVVLESTGVIDKS
jgi:hypothetical protein